MENFLIIVPAISGYVTSTFCNVSRISGAQVAFRPPPVVFATVWPILYLLFGIAWVISRRTNTISTDVFYSLLTILLCVWIFVYSCKNNKMWGVYVLLLSIICSIWCYSVGNMLSKCLLAPLMGWLLFALLLNISEVQNVDSTKQESYRNMNFGNHWN